jgi:hypothetical protein
VTIEAKLPRNDHWKFWTIEAKLPRNDHWKVLYKVSVFYADRKSKMATTLPFYIGTKSLNFVEDNPMNIPV